ncbi:MAG: hypothetical protein E6J39_04195 [Chloroflexi bacterium]|nr:MAG: hypothetical protein E6J39_04195 [Chloroflexota bacterium]
MNDESTDRATGLVLEGPPPHAVRPSWLALFVAVIIALLVGTAFGYGIAVSPTATPRAAALASLSVLPIPTATPSPTPSAIAVYFGVEASRGLLTPGTYAYLNVDGTAFTNVRFRVPTGWTWDGRSLSKGGGGTPHGAAIFFFDAVVQVYADPCHWAAGPAHPPTGSTAAALMAALAAQPSRRATMPTKRPANAPGLASGWQGTSIQLTVPDHINFADCDKGQYRSWGPDNEARSHQGPGQRDLVWAVDLGPYDRLIIDAAWFPGTPTEVKSEIEAILRSIAAGHWG